MDLVGHLGKVYDKIFSESLMYMILTLKLTAQLELLKQLTIKHLEKEYLYPNNSLWIVLEVSITLVVMVDFLLKHLNTSNIMVGLTQRRLILILAKTVAANSQLKTLVYEFLTLSTSPR